MAHTVTDTAGKPVAAVLDAEESAYIVPAIHKLMLRPGFTVPPPVLDALRVLEDVAARWRPDMSADMSANGHAVVTPEPTDPILDSKGVAELLGLSERQARRWCAQHGRKVAGRWTAHRDDVEKVS